MERGIHHDPYHVRFVQVLLTRALGVRIPDMHDEITTAFAELVPPTKGERSVAYMYLLFMRLSRMD